MIGIHITDYQGWESIFFLPEMLTSRIKMYFKFLVSKTLLFYFLESEIIRVIENKEWGKR